VWPAAESAAQATIGVRSEAARAWLQHRLASVIRRILSRLLGKPVALSFVLLTPSS
jgi:chromosomal replication initiation ATPase DnaA